MLACVERRDARVPRRSRASVRSSSPSSTRERASSSARRSRRSRPSSRGSPMRRSRRTPSPCSRGRPPSNDGGLQEPELRLAGSACCDVTAVGAPGARRRRLRARDRPARLLPARPLGARLGDRRLRAPPAESARASCHSGERTCSIAQSSHSMRDSAYRIPPSRAIRNVRAFLFAPVGSSLMRRNSASSRGRVVALALELLHGLLGLEQPEEERAERRVVADAPLGRRCSRASAGSRRARRRSARRSSSCARPAPVCSMRPSSRRRASSG